MTDHDFISASGPEYVYRDELEDRLDEREVMILKLVNSLWREVVILRVLLCLTGGALLLVTITMAVRT